MFLGMRLTAGLLLDYCKRTSFVFFDSSAGVTDTVFRFEPAFADTDWIPLILDSTTGFWETVSCIGEVPLAILVYTHVLFFLVGVLDTVFRFESAFADTDGTPLILDTICFMFSFSVGVIDTVFRFKPAFADTDGIPLILDSTSGFWETVSCIGEVPLAILVSAWNFLFFLTGDWQVFFYWPICGRIEGSFSIKILARFLSGF